MRHALWIMAALFGLAACQPVTQLRTVDERPGILVPNAPLGAVLMVDGLAAGALRGADGAPVAIRIEPGTHQLAVVAGGQALLQQRVFVSGDAVKTLALPGAAP